MNVIFTPELLYSLGAIALVLLTSILPEFTPQWEQIVNSVVAILIALLTARLANYAVSSYFAVKAQELEFRYGGERAIRVEAKSESDFYPSARG